MYDQSAISEYQQVSVESGVSASDPHNMVTMLFDGLLERLANASGAVERNDVAKKGEALSSAIRIIDGLRASLDLSRGGEIAQNLGSMYDYMERRLLEANSTADVAIIAEVSSLVRQLKSGWEAIPEELKGA